MVYNLLMQTRVEVGALQQNNADINAALQQLLALANNNA